jgi:protein TonB
LGQYSSTLGRAIAKHKQYPKVAQMRGWQGDCLLDLKLDGSGNVLSASVKESSGHEVLDNQALEMARKAAPFPAPPEVLRDRSFNLTVPVSFKLE